MKITEFVRSHDMLPPGTKVLCAVSGGADSVCLLRWLSENKDTLKIELAAAHYEHGIRGEESLRDMHFVEKLCAEWNIPLVTERGNVPQYAKDKSLGLEEAARELRYGFLYRAAEQSGCDRIATAHNADDNVETVLLNLVRGTGTAGLCGIPPVRDKLIRPLLSTSRKEIEEFLSSRNIPHVEDSSNRSNDMSRNRIRMQVVPVLRELNPGLSGSVLRMTELLAQDEAQLSALADDFIVRYYDGASLPLKQLSKLPEAVASRVIRKLCPERIGKVHTDDIIKLSKGTELAYIDVPGARIRRQKGRMYFTDPPVPKKTDKKP